MLEYLDQIDQSLFLFLNGINSPFWDQAMDYITSSRTWFPLYIAIIVTLIYKFKKQGLYMVITLLLLVGFADQVSSRLAKPGFARLRPFVLAVCL